MVLCFKVFSRLNIRRKKCFALFCFSVFSVIVYISLNMQSHAWYANRKNQYLLPAGKGHSCQTPKMEMMELKELTRDMDSILKELKVTHVLIYGSLWGAIRYNDPLPWDNDVDMALFDEEVQHLDVELLIEKFKQRNIDISYRLWFGTYRVTRGTARGDLMVFRKSFFGDMWRTGIEPWVFFVNYRRFHTFPAALVEQPLPKTLFAGVNISVPRHGIEIQKHFYPHDWWIESKPRGC